MALIAEPDEDPAALVALVLEQEALRQEEQAARSETTDPSGHRTERATKASVRPEELARIAALGAVPLLFALSILANAFGPLPAILLAVAAALSAGLVLLRRASMRGESEDPVRPDDDARHRRAEDGSEPLLEALHVDYSYGPVQVLFDVSLDVFPGEVLALLGTNGAGKSTLLRAISGLGTVDRGVVLLGGAPITSADPPARVRLGIVQVSGGKAVFPALTVQENLQAGAFIYGKDHGRIQAKIEHVLGLFPHLQERLHQTAGTLSGGEQQMLALGKALLLEPRVLLIDELSLGLAPVVVQGLLKVIDGLKEQGIGVVLVEQSVNISLSIADRAIFMEKGQVRFSGRASDLLKRDDLVRAVFLGGDGG